MIRTFAYAAACAAVLAAPAFAQQATVTKDSDGNPTINIQVSEQAQAINERYKRAVSELTPEQQARIEQIGELNGEAVGAIVSINGHKARFRDCRKFHPDLRETHAGNLENYIFTQEDRLAGARQRVRAAVAAVDFMDKRLLQAKMDVDAKSMSALGNGMIEAIVQKGGYNREACDKLVADLDGHATPYAPLRKNVAMDVSAITPPGSGMVKACMAGWKHHTPDGKFISAALVYANKGEGRGDTSFSFKLFSAPSGDTSKIAEAWLDFRALKTRFTARGERKNEELYIGGLAPVDILKALVGMRDNPVVISIRPVGAEDAYALKTPLFPREKLSDFADCVVAVTPAFAAPLRKAGFNPAVDESMTPARNAQTDWLYKTHPMQNADKGTGVCMWQIGPAGVGEDAEIAGALMVTGYMKPGASNNFTAALWALGSKGRARLSFTDAAYDIVDAKTGQATSSRDLQTKAIPGQRYEVHIPFDAVQGLVENIGARGVTMHANAPALGGMVTHDFPPPKPEARKAYEDCMADLLASGKDRMTPDAAAP